MTAEQIQASLIGRWASLAPELRPSASRNADGTAKPFYLQREFTAMPGERFELSIVTSADPFGAVPLARLRIRGHMQWRGAHPVAPGAQKVDFTADEGFDVTPLHAGFVGLLNQVASQGFEPWVAGQTQSVLDKAFAPFALAEGHPFKEYDLVYLRHGLLFWGARHVDGRGFDTEENRPTNLQIPLERKP